MKRCSRTASRARIISQLLTETLSLAALGGIVGLAIAFWADKALLSIYLPADSTDLNITTLPDFRVLVFTLRVTILTGIVFGLVPALQTTRPEVRRVLNDEAATPVGGGHAGR